MSGAILLHNIAWYRYLTLIRYTVRHVRGTLSCTHVWPHDQAARAVSARLLVRLDLGLCRRPAQQQQPTTEEAHWNERSTLTEISHNKRHMGTTQCDCVRSLLFSLIFTS